MADWVKIQAQLEKLINDANSKMETNKTNLTDVVNDLIKGYGQSGGSVIPKHKLLDLEVEKSTASVV